MSLVNVMKLKFGNQGKNTPPFCVFLLSFTSLHIHPSLLPFCLVIPQTRPQQQREISHLPNECLVHLIIFLTGFWEELRSIIKTLIRQMSKIYALVKRSGHLRHIFFGVLHFKYYYTIFIILNKISFLYYLKSWYWHISASVWSNAAPEFWKS